MQPVSWRCQHCYIPLSRADQLIGRLLLADLLRRPPPFLLRYPHQAPQSPLRVDRESGHLIKSRRCSIEPAPQLPLLLLFVTGFRLGRLCLDLLCRLEQRRGDGVCFEKGVCFLLSLHVS